MIAALLVVYVVLEIAVLVWLGSTIGIVWTVCLFLAGSLLGLLLVGSQGRRAIRELRRAGRGETAPSAAVADGALVGVGSVLMFVPGLVTSALGLLLLSPPTRRLLRPAVLFVAGRRMGLVAGEADVLAWTTVTRRGGYASGTVIEGEVLDERFEDQRGNGSTPPPQPRYLPPSGHTDCP